MNSCFSFFSSSNCISHYISRFDLMLSTTQKLMSKWRTNSFFFLSVFLFLGVIDWRLIILTWMGQIDESLIDFIEMKNSNHLHKFYSLRVVKYSARCHILFKNVIIYFLRIISCRVICPNFSVFQNSQCVCSKKKNPI